MMQSVMFNAIAVMTCACFPYIHIVGVLGRRVEFMMDHVFFGINMRFIHSGGNVLGGIDDFDIYCCCLTFFGSSYL